MTQTMIQKMTVGLIFLTISFVVAVFMTGGGKCDVRNVKVMKLSQEKISPIVQGAAGEPEARQGLQEEQEQGVMDDSHRTEQNEKREAENSSEEGQNNSGYGAIEYKIVRYTVGAYCGCEDCCEEWAKNGNRRKTAGGYWLREGLAAVNPQDIPYGTIMFIFGYGLTGKALAADTGGKCRRTKKYIEVFFWSHKKAVEWGIREIDVWIFVGWRKE